MDEFTQERVEELAALIADNFIVMGTKTNRLEEFAASHCLSISRAARIVVYSSVLRFKQLSQISQQNFLDQAHLLLEVVEELGGEEKIATMNLKDFTVQDTFGTNFYAAWAKRQADLKPDPLFTKRPFSMLSKPTQKEVLRQLNGLQIWQKSQIQPQKGA